MIETYKSPGVLVQDNTTILRLNSTASPTRTSTNHLVKVKYAFFSPKTCYSVIHHTTQYNNVCVLYAILLFLKSSYRTFDYDVCYLYFWLSIHYNYVTCRQSELIHWRWLKLLWVLHIHLLCLFYRCHNREI